MEKTIDAKIHNRFDISVVDSRTGIIKQRAYAENILLNQLWPLILRFPKTDQNDTDGTFAWWTNIHVGSGTGTLAATRTALFTPLLVRAISDPVYAQNTDENWMSLRHKIVLLETEYNGSVLSEVGIGKSTILCSHALLKDMNGNAVTITKVDTDIITIYATVYLRMLPVWSKDAAVTFRRMLAGENWFAAYLLGGTHGTFFYHEPAMYPDKVELFKGNAVCAAQGSSKVVYTGTLTHTFDVANKKDTMYCRIPAASANVDGIKSFALAETWASSLANSSVFGNFSNTSHTQPTVVEQIGTGDGSTLLFATTFPFVKSGAVIKIDGVAASASVITGVPKVKDIKEYMYNLGTTGNGEHAKTCAFPAGTNTAGLILENPLYATYGIDSIACADCKLSTSDDMITWTQVYSGTGTYTVAAEHKQKRYWKAEKAATTAWNITAMNCNALDALKNVIFSTAPATGAIITAEYNTDVVTKDANHVLDITVVLQFGEYAP